MEKDISVLLENAIKNNEFQLFVMGDPKYSAEGYDKNTGYSTNFRQIAASISSLETRRPELKPMIKSTILSLLAQGKPGFIMKVAKIVVSELRSGRQGSVLIEEDVLVSLKNTINSNLEKLYEEEVQSLKMDDAIVFGTTGRHIM